MLLFIYTTLYFYMFFSQIWHFLNLTLQSKTLQTINIMSKSPVPLKVVTPQSKKLQFPRNNDFYTFDINGRSYSPQNQEESIYHIFEPNKTISTDYENKKFKIRQSSNSVKTTRNWKYIPPQRIRKVDNLIEVQKLKQRLFNLSSGPFDQQLRNDLKLTANSPKRQDIGFNSLQIRDMGSANENQRLKQIQQLIRIERQKAKQKLLTRNNIIKYGRKIHSIQTKQFMNLVNDKQFGNQTQDSWNKFHPTFKSSIYSQIMKNRKKLSQKRHTKKKPSEYSLLGRINSLNKNQENSFILRNSPRLERSEQKQQQQQQSINRK